MQDENDLSNLPRWQRVLAYIGIVAFVVFVFWYKGHRVDWW